MAYSVFRIPFTTIMPVNLLLGPPGRKYPNEELFKTRINSFFIKSMLANLVGGPVNSLVYQAPVSNAYITHARFVPRHVLDDIAMSAYARAGGLKRLHGYFYVAVDSKDEALLDRALRRSRFFTVETGPSAFEIGAYSINRLSQPRFAGKPVNQAIIPASAQPLQSPEDAREACGPAGTYTCFPTTTGTGQACYCLKYTYTHPPETKRVTTPLGVVANPPFPFQPPLRPHLQQQVPAGLQARAR